MPVFEQMDKNLQPRERLENAESILALSDEELLGLIIRIGRTGRNAVEVGRELKDAFGSVRNMVYADWREIAHAGVQGVGKVKAMELAAAFELARRGAKLPAEDYTKPVTEARQVFEHVRALGGGGQPGTFLRPLPRSEAALAVSAESPHDGSGGRFAHPSAGALPGRHPLGRDFVVRGPQPFERGRNPFPGGRGIDGHPAGSVGSAGHPPA